MPDSLMQYFAKLGLDSSEFLNGIAKADAGVLQFYRDVTISLGATMFIFDKFLAYGEKFIGLANDAMVFQSTIDKLAVTTGMSSSELYKWANVARYADSDISSLSAMIRKMSIGMNDTGAAGEEVTAILDAMGISTREADGSTRSMNEIFPEVITGLNGIEDAGKRNSAAMSLFGRSYQELAGYMLLTKDEMQDLFDTGFAPSSQQQQALRNYEQATKDLDRSVSDLNKTIGIQITPSLTEIVNVINNDLIPALREVSEISEGLGLSEGLHLFVDMLDDAANGAEILKLALDANITNYGEFTSKLEAIQSEHQANKKRRDEAFETAGLMQWMSENPEAVREIPGLQAVQEQIKKNATPRVNWSPTSPEGTAAKTISESEIVLSGIENLKEGKMTLDDLRWAVDQGTISWQQYNDIIGGLETSRIEDQKDAVEKLTESISDMQDKLNESQRNYARDLQTLDSRDVQGFINLQMRHTWEVQDQQTRINTATAELNSVQSGTPLFPPAESPASKGESSNITITGPIYLNGDKSFEKMLENQRIRAGVRLR